MLVFLLWMGCTPKKSKPTNCTRLDSMLRSVGTASDPLAEAQQKGLLVNESQVRVMISLREGETPFWDPPAKTELSIKERHQVLLAPKQLCSVGNDPRVQSISVPKKPSPKKPSSK